MPQIDPSSLNTLIRNRRSVFPASFIDKEIPKEILQEILENANWAPSHKHTEPWRFKVIRGVALQRLGLFLGDAYEKVVSKERFSPMKLKKTIKKPTQCAAVIAICMQRDQQERIPEWEELAATACAVQNLWLSCSAYNIGGYWSSPKTIDKAGEFFKMQKGEKCIGFFYMGYYEQDIPEGKREPIADKVLWIDE